MIKRDCEGMKFVQRKCICINYFYSQKNHEQSQVHWQLHATLAGAVVVTFRLTRAYTIFHEHHEAEG
jgi:hypothetical protein